MFLTPHWLTAEQLKFIGIRSVAASKPSWLPDLGSTNDDAEMLDDLLAFERPDATSKEFD
jgi:hypothetical protein